VVLTAGVRAPRDFMAPHTCDGSLHQAEAETCIGPASGCPDLELRQGLDCTYLALLRAVMWFHRSYRASHEKFRALL
jgi:hypothetical protein